jgi:hypothetical protein
MNNFQLGIRLPQGVHEQLQCYTKCQILPMFCNLETAAEFDRFCFYFIKILNLKPFSQLKLNYHKTVFLTSSKNRRTSNKTCSEHSVKIRWYIFHITFIWKYIAEYMILEKIWRECSLIWNVWLYLGSSKLEIILWLIDNIQEEI